jgi:dolichol-phosphate mannosyltransferase
MGPGFGLLDEANAAPRPRPGEGDLAARPSEARWLGAEVAAGRWPRPRPHRYSGPTLLYFPSDRCSLSIVVPTRNEAANVALLVSRLGGALRTHPGGWEIIFVDDSDDGTPLAIAALEAEGLPVRLHHRRPGRRPGGLGGAVQDGFRRARGGVVVVMDADLQHPPEVVPTLVAPILAGRVDLAVGSRYRGGGNARGLEGRWRRWVSRFGRSVVHLAVPRSRELSDPLSGLFAFDRRVLDGIKLEPDGFKILLEVVARGRWGVGADIGYHFAHRNAGTSKASLHEGLVFVRHLLNLSRVVGPPAPPLATPGRRADNAADRPLAPAVR